MADWAGDGVDLVWARDETGVPGWFRWPAGLAVVPIPQATHVIGLSDIDGDGIDELLYFQGNSLVIQRR